MTCSGGGGGSGVGIKLECMFLETRQDCAGYFTSRWHFLVILYIPL